MSRRGWIHVLVPVVTAVAGIIWVELALRHFEATTNHERRGVIGSHHSIPSWGFDYRPQGRAVEMWALHVPRLATSLVLLASAVIGAWRRRREWGMRRIAGLVVMHLLAWLGFVVWSVLLWAEAADVFI